MVFFSRKKSDKQFTFISKRSDSAPLYHLQVFDGETLYYEAHVLHREAGDGSAAKYHECTDDSAQALHDMTCEAFEHKINLYNHSGVGIGRSGVTTLSEFLLNAYAYLTPEDREKLKLPDLTDPQFPVQFLLWAHDTIKCDLLYPYEQDVNVGQLEDVLKTTAHLLRLHQIPENRKKITARVSLTPAEIRDTLALVSTQQRMITSWLAQRPSKQKMNSIFSEGFLGFLFYPIRKPLELLVKKTWRHFFQFIALAACYAGGFMAGCVASGGLLGVGILGSYIVGYIAPIIVKEIAKDLSLRWYRNKPNENNPGKKILNPTYPNKWNLTEKQTERFGTTHSAIISELLNGIHQAKRLVKKVWWFPQTKVEADVATALETLRQTVINQREPIYPPRLSEETLACVKREDTEMSRYLKKYPRFATRYKFPILHAANGYETLSNQYAGFFYNSKYETGRAVVNPGPASAPASAP